jgi:ADP-ribose pyrophosphatase YjhB (NUDIX family)
MVWKPNVTVAAVAERAGRFLLVEEETERGRLYNQPAGHLDAGESLIQAVVREALEETAHVFEPSGLLGVYQYHSEPDGLTYLRFAFAGTMSGHDPHRPLDHGILRAVWLSAEEVRRESARHRSPLVMRCIEDYQAGRRYPLDVLHYYA